jgi:hypothetical protein
MEATTEEILNEVEMGGEALIKKLLAYTLVRLKGLVLRGKSWKPGTVLPEGMTEEDLVHKAVELALGGDRKWNKEEDPKFEDFMTGIIRSLAGHLATGAENGLMRSSVGRTRDGQEFDRIERATSPTRNPEEQTFSGKHAALQKAFIQSMFDDLGNEPEMAAVLEQLLDDKQPSEIAAAVGLKATDIFNLQRRLHRRARTLSAKPEFSSLTAAPSGGLS